VSTVRRARALGLRIEIVDLGASNALFSEYDARAGAIRVSGRHLHGLRGRARRRFLVEAVAHELYHHLEYAGEVERLRTRAQRDAAAERCARAAVS
jgi:hypothetical protein